MGESDREDLVNNSWKIEEYHIGIKQYCDVKKCQAKKKVVDNAYNVFIKSFSEAGVKKGQKWDILV